MATTTRLTFLYPHLFRSAPRLGEPSAQQVGRAHAHSHSPPCRKAGPPIVVCQQNAAPFTTSTCARQSTFAKRHGKAVEPLPMHSVPKTQPAPTWGSKADGAAEKKTPAKVKEAAAAKTGAAGDVKDGVEDKKIRAASETQSKSNQEETRTDGDSSASAEEVTSKSGSESSAASEPLDMNAGTSSPMDAILHMGPPPSSSSSSSSSSDFDPPSSSSDHPFHKSPPHLTPPPYVHHFDSYSLVKQLETGGWTRAQAITAMKAVRGLLAANNAVAQDGLVSKSDVENETYLFRAACSELSTEVRNNRRVADEGMRQQRTLLQHEVDILTQRLNQEVLMLNDNVRGMFNDRRMAVREEQKAAESAIQQINYKISVELNSDARSEIEALRWVLIRRSVLGIIFMAILTLGSLRYASYLSHEKQKAAVEAAKKAAEEKEGKKLFDPTTDRTSAPEAAEILAAN